MSEPKITQCKSCNANIFFVTSKNGKYIPVDAEIITSNGNDILWVDETAGFKKLAEGRKGYISHFATCPDADKFRK